MDLNKSILFLVCCHDNFALLCTQYEFLFFKQTHKIVLEPKDLYNAMYIAAMVKADYWGSSIEDDEHLAKYVEDVLCDVDAAEGQTFARFVADCSLKGIPIYWEQMI